MQVEKAGATVLFEDPAKRGNTIGVVVNPVRISSLKDFGTPSVVADKLIAAERKKVTFYQFLHRMLGCFNGFMSMRLVCCRFQYSDDCFFHPAMQPSTNDAQLVRVQERQANGDIPLYCLEYTLDSSRGQKRILSAVTVASKKLYILNITYVDSAAAPAPAAMAEAFTQVLNSFDLVA